MKDLETRQSIKGETCTPTSIHQAQSKSSSTTLVTVTPTSPDYWFELLSALDVYDAKILEHVYQSQQGATTLQLLVRQLRHVGIQREAIRRRVLMLTNLGLLDVAVRTKPLCICGRVELEANVLTLVKGVYRRTGVQQ